MDTQVAIVTITQKQWEENQAMLKYICDKVSEISGKEQKEMLTTKEVMKVLKIGATTIQRYIVNGTLNPIRINKLKYSKVLFKREDIEKLINEPEQ